MDKAYRDSFTNDIEGYYSRRVFFGDITINEVPKDIKEKVIKELKSLDLNYLVEE